MIYYNATISTKRNQAPVQTMQWVRAQVDFPTRAEIVMAHGADLPAFMTVPLGTNLQEDDVVTIISYDGQQDYRQTSYVARAVQPKPHPLGAITCQLEGTPNV